MIFMEKLKGMVFSKYIDKTLPNNLDEVEEVTQKIFQKIRDLHELGYIHLDLHVENIWVNKDKTVYLLDYGYVKQSTNREDRQDDFIILLNHIIKYNLNGLEKKYSSPKTLSDLKKYQNILDYKSFIQNQSYFFLRTLILDNI